MATGTIRPNGSSGVYGPVAVVGAGSIAAALADENDGTYVRFGNNGSDAGFIVDFDTFTFPAGTLTVNSAYHSFRVWGDNNDWENKLSICRVGSPNAAWQYITTDPTTYTNTATTTTGNAPISTQAHLDNYQVQCTSLFGIETYLLRLSMTIDYTVTAAAVPSYKTWNGSSFVASPVKTWNGTAFVQPVGIKVWNGTAWVNAL